MGLVVCGFGIETGDLVFHPVLVLVMCLMMWCLEKHYQKKQSLTKKSADNVVVVLEEVKEEEHMIPGFEKNVVMVNSSSGSINSEDPIRDRMGASCCDADITNTQSVDEQDQTEQQNSYKVVEDDKKTNQKSTAFSIVSNNPTRSTTTKTSTTNAPTAVVVVDNDAALHGNASIRSEIGCCSESSRRPWQTVLKSKNNYSVVVDDNNKKKVGCTIDFDLQQQQQPVVDHNHQTVHTTEKTSHQILSEKERKNVVYKTAYRCWMLTRFIYETDKFLFDHVKRFIPFDWHARYGTKTHNETEVLIRSMSCLSMAMKHIRENREDYMDKIPLIKNLCNQRLIECGYKGNWNDYRTLIRELWDEIHRLQAQLSLPTQLAMAVPILVSSSTASVSRSVILINKIISSFTKPCFVSE